MAPVIPLRAILGIRYFFAGVHPQKLSAPERKKCQAMALQEWVGNNAEHLESQGFLRLIYQTPHYAAGRETVNAG